MIGLAQGLQVKTFADYTDGDVEEKMNQFLKDNPFFEIVKIIYFNGYSTMQEDIIGYGRETGMIVYRETKVSKMQKDLLEETLEKFGYKVDKSKK